MNRISLAVFALLTMQLVGCASTPKHDLAHYPYPKAQAEIRSMLDSMRQNVSDLDADGLRACHLESEKFTKFAGRRFERMDIAECNRTESKGLASVEAIESESRDVKIDVFGELAVVTWYANKVATKKDGQQVRKSGRVSVVLLNTHDGWKIVHEHVTPKTCFGGSVE